VDVQIMVFWDETMCSLVGNTATSPTPPVWK